MLKEFYENRLSWNTRISSILGMNHSELDQHILMRNPPLSFREDGKIDIDRMYPQSMELRTDPSPYYEFYECLKKTFDLTEIKTFCDVGCATGHLVQKMLSHADAKGIEYFAYQKENAKEEVKDRISIFDIRNPILSDEVFDLVSCTEVAEHVDPKYLDTFLDNIRKITGKYLILTWSDAYPPQDAPPQHVSPLYISDVKKVMNSWGFTLDQEKTNSFIQESMGYSNFYHWWRDSLTIWRVV